MSDCHQTTVSKAIILHCHISRAIRLKTKLSPHSLQISLVLRRYSVCAECVWYAYISEVWNKIMYSSDLYHDSVLIHVISVTYIKGNNEYYKLE